MHRFRVWAPKAKTLDVKLSSQLHPMRKTTGGWWEADIASAFAGADYAFVVDGESPDLPDPRSVWQPNGVHAPSRLLDHSTFHWTDDHWQHPPLSSAVIYELHIGTYTPEGTLDAALTRLPYLQDLGITHVELMPVASFPGARGWGYDGV